jgi:hypothetical protein
MTDQQRCPTHTMTVTLAPGETATALLRLVSVLHRRGAGIQYLSFRSEDRLPMDVTVQVTLRNTGWPSLQESLRRLVEVLHVEVGPHASDPRAPGRPASARTSCPGDSLLVVAGIG